MGQPVPINLGTPHPEYIGVREGSRGTETSQYPDEKKATCDPLSSGERTGASLNPGHAKGPPVVAGVLWGRGCALWLVHRW